MRGIVCCGLALLRAGLMAGAAAIVGAAPAAWASPARTAPPARTATTSPAPTATAPPGSNESIGSWGPGAWSWFADPRAVEVDGKTFVGWIDWDGRVTIGGFDPDGGAQAYTRYVLG